MLWRAFASDGIFFRASPENRSTASLLICPLVYRLSLLSARRARVPAAEVFAYRKCRPPRFAKIASVRNAADRTA